MSVTTTNRVEMNTSGSLNTEFQKQLEANVAKYVNATKVELDAHLAELDKEWDVERVLQTNFSALCGLASTVNKRWSALAIGVPAFMIQHALQGWCPPLAILRRLGVRTAKEINDERFALQAQRGDFALVRSSSDTTAAHEAVKDSGRPDLQ